MSFLVVGGAKICFFPLDEMSSMPLTTLKILLIHFAIESLYSVMYHSLEYKYYIKAPPMC